MPRVFLGFTNNFIMQFHIDWKVERCKMTLCLCLWQIHSRTSWGVLFHRQQQTSFATLWELISWINCIFSLHEYHWIRKYTHTHTGHSTQPHTFSCLQWRKVAFAFCGMRRTESHLLSSYWKRHWNDSHPISNGSTNKDSWNANEGEKLLAYKQIAKMAFYAHSGQRLNFVTWHRRHSRAQCRFHSRLLCTNTGNFNGKTLVQNEMRACSK